MTLNAGKNCKNLWFNTFRFGSNIRTLPIGRSFWRLFFSQLNDGFILLLVAFSVVQIFVCILSGDFIYFLDSLTVLCAVVFVAVITSVCEYTKD